MSEEAEDPSGPSNEGDAQPPELAPLVPAPAVQKFLISTTCHLADRFQSPAILIAEARPGLGNWSTHQRLNAVDNARTVMALVFRTDPEAQGGLIIPQYDGAADFLCALLALLYGKRFDLHGAVENSGFFGLPDFRHLDTYSDPCLPQNGPVVRADFPFPHTLAVAGQILTVALSHHDDLEPFKSAAKFYLQALRTVEQDVEMAYLHLISAGEVLTGSMDLCADALVDSKTRNLLEKIEAEMPDGAKIARIIRGKLRSIKRRFVAGLQSLVEPDFFARGDAIQARLRPTAADFAKRLGAAYDLRSKYIHTGRPFGDRVGPYGVDFTEVQFGEPMAPTREEALMLLRAPTYVGLERILRYCLLRYLQTLGLPLEVPQGNAEGDQG